MPPSGSNPVQQPGRVGRWLAGAAAAASVIGVAWTIIVYFVPLWTGGGNANTVVLKQDFSTLSSLPYCDGRQPSSAWCTDAPTAISLDNNGHGQDASRSVRLVAGGKNQELFTPLVRVDPARAYTVASYWDLVKGSADAFVYYVDEYNGAQRDLGSGRFIGQRIGAGRGSVQYAYKPSTAAVFARIQIIVKGASHATAYCDDFSWGTS